nr:hypothetical protein [Candidatus Bathyarchaeota archaeon]
MEEKVMREEWLTPLSKVIFPFTGRDGEFNAALIAFQIIEEMGGELVGFHVLSEEGSAAKFKEELLKVARKFKVSFRIICYDERNIISGLLNELKRGYDLCICSLGIKGVKGLGSGSVVRKLINKIPIKLLLVYTPESYGVLPYTLNRILVTHTMMDEDVAAYMVAMVLSKSWLSIKGEIIAVYPIRVPSSVPIDLTYVAEEIERKEDSFLKDIGSEIKEMGSPILPVTLYARDKAEALAVYSKEVDADIVIIGVNRRKYLSRLASLMPLSYPRFINELLRRASCP